MTGAAHDGRVWVRGAQCDACLLSPNRIVSGARAAELVRVTAHNDGGPFICHKDATDGEPTAICRSWYDQLGDRVNSVRIAQRLGLISYTETHGPCDMCGGTGRYLRSEPYPEDGAA